MHSDATMPCLSLSLKKLRSRAPEELTTQDFPKQCSHSPYNKKEEKKEEGKGEELFSC